jgi:hypothetical protein
MTTGIRRSYGRGMTHTNITSPGGFTRTGSIVAGASGLTAIALIAVVITMSTSPDATGADATARIQTWLTDPGASSGATLAIALSALSYAPMLVFFAGIRSAVTSWGGSSIVPNIVAIGSALFLAGAIVGDTLIWAVPLALATSPGVEVPPAVLVVLDRGWLIALVEAHIALAAVAAGTAMAGIRARRRGSPVSLVVLILSVIAALSAVPLLVAPTTQAVLLVTNQTRLLWLIVMAIWMIVRGISQRPTLAEQDHPVAHEPGLLGQ